MWMIPPKLLCNQHLLGEHSEIHKHRHNFEKQHSMTGRIYPKVLIEPLALETRHDILVDEMLSRGMNHQSPFEQPDVSYLPDDQRYALVNRDTSMSDLLDRCDDCAHRIINWLEE